MKFLANENFLVFSIKLLRKADHNVASVICAPGFTLAWNGRYRTGRNERTS